MAIEYVRRTPTTNQEYFNSQLQQAINQIVNRVNIDYTKITTATYSIKVDELFLDVNVSTSVALTLPTKSPIGTNYIIKDTSGNASTHNIYISAGSGETIEGVATKTISTNYGSLKIIYNGNNKWLTF